MELLLLPRLRPGHEEAIEPDEIPIVVARTEGRDLVLRAFEGPVAAGTANSHYIPVGAEVIHAQAEFERLVPAVGRGQFIDVFGDQQGFELLVADGGTGVPVG